MINESNFPLVKLNCNAFGSLQNVARATQVQWNSIKVKYFILINEFRFETIIQGNLDSPVSFDFVPRVEYNSFDKRIICSSRGVAIIFLH